MPVDADVVLAKVAAIDRCLGRIADVTGGDPARLDELDVQDIVVLNLQRAAQASIDVAQHVVAEEALGLPSSMADTFAILRRHGRLDAELADQMRAMVGFRNVAVHAYEEIDADILRAIVDHHLLDLRGFAAWAAGLVALDGLANLSIDIGDVDELNAELDAGRYEDDA